MSEQPIYIPTKSKPSSGDFGPKIGLAEGICWRCGKVRRKPYPATEAYCDCWEFCPVNHGNGPFGTHMDDYHPQLGSIPFPGKGDDVEKIWDPANYRAIELGVPGGVVYGDLEHPLEILKVCPVCSFHSSQKPILVPIQ